LYILYKLSRLDAPESLWTSKTDLNEAICLSIVRLKELNFINILLKIIEFLLKNCRI